MRVRIVMMVVVVGMMMMHSTEMDTARPAHATCMTGTGQSTRDMSLASFRVSKCKSDPGSSPQDFTSGIGLDMQCKVRCWIRPEPKMHV
eukprot:1812951-Rhodomonas_salina.2